VGGSGALDAEAVRAFSELRAEVANGSLPAEEHLVPLDPEVREAFDLADQS
jgi:hypothetical protein